MLHLQWHLANNVVAYIFNLIQHRISNLAWKKANCIFPLFYFQAKLAFERLPIPKVYHPFICGPNKETINRLSEETGAKISVPPHKDEIVVSGEKDGVLRCKQTIMAIYEEKVSGCVVSACGHGCVCQWQLTVKKLMRYIGLPPIIEECREPDGQLQREIEISLQKETQFKSINSELHSVCMS